MHYIVLFLKKVLKDPYLSEVHHKSAIQSIQVMIFSYSKVDHKYYHL